MSSTVSRVRSIRLAAAFINIRRLKIANSNKFNSLTWFCWELWSRVSGRATHNSTSQRRGPSWWKAPFGFSIPLVIARGRTWGLLWLRLSIYEDLRLQAQTTSTVSFGVAVNCEAKWAGGLLTIVSHKVATQADGTRFSRVASRLQSHAPKPGACFGCVC